MNEPLAILAYFSIFAGGIWLNLSLLSEIKNALCSFWIHCLVPVFTFPSTSMALHMTLNTCDYCLLNVESDHKTAECVQCAYVVKVTALCRCVRAN